MRAFTLALKAWASPCSALRIAPTPKLVDQFFNDLTGEGDYGEVDARGPWNEGGEWEFVESPAIADLDGFAGAGQEGAPSMHAENSGSGNEAIRELLVEQLRDILHLGGKAADEGVTEDGEVGTYGAAPTIVRDSP